MISNLKRVAAVAVAAGTIAILAPAASAKADTPLDPAGLGYIPGVVGFDPGGVDFVGPSVGFGGAAVIGPTVLTNGAGNIFTATTITTSAGGAVVTTGTAAP
jgi:hypothetical protein